MFVGRTGLGSFSKPHYDKTHRELKSELVQDEIRAEVEEERYSKMVGMYKQGGCTSWEHVEPHKITWTSGEPESPGNLHSWVMANSMPTVAEEEHLGAHPQLLPKGIGGKTIPLAP